jgi:hypothetical protein
VITSASILWQMTQTDLLFERIASYIQIRQSGVVVIERDEYLSVISVQGIELIFGTETLAPGTDGLDVTSWLGMTAIEQISEADGIGILRQATPEQYSLFALVGDHRDYWLGTRIPITIGDLMLERTLQEFLEHVRTLRANDLFTESW